MTKRSRSRRLKNSEQLLGAGASGRAYAIGVIGPDPRRTAAILVMVFAVAVALSFVFLGVIVIPGFLLVAAIRGAIDRPASVAVTDQGIAVFARSEFNGRPRKVLAVLPQSVLTDRMVRSGAYVHLPHFELWFRKKEYERLLAAVDGAGVVSHWAAPVAAGASAFAQAGGSRLPPSPPPSSAATAPSFTPPVATGSAASQSEDESRLIYCSWCGKQRPVDAQAIHHCGSMERPTVYCMTCGFPLEGAPACTSCGTPATQISR
jgi:hypothetical protein